MEVGEDDPSIVWVPKENSGYQMKRFMKRIEQKYSVKFNGYWDLHKWSVDNVIDFWSEMWDYAGIICSKKCEKVVDLSIPLEQCPKWFEGARLNYTENMLKNRGNRVAFIFAGEESETEKTTFNQLFDEVSLYAAALRKAGFKKGDVAAGYISNKKEAIFAMFAVVSIGGIWTGALPLLGSKAVLDRFSQTKPKILLTTDRLSYNREEYQLLQNIEEIVNGLPSLESVLIVPSKDSSMITDIRNIRNSSFLDDFLKSGREADGSVPPIEFEQVSMSHPIFINFTSGTTGLPKPVMHGSGILLSLFKEFFIHCDSEPGSVWLGPSPTGWATWNIFVSLVMFGNAVLMYDGLPFYMSPTYIWDMVDEHNISHMWIPTSIIEELVRRNYMPTEIHSLKSLKMFYAGGSVVKPSMYDDIYQKLKGYCMFSSGFGCTEFMGSCFFSDFTLPLYRGEISATTLGYNLLCLNDEGQRVLGEIGELAIISPVPNLPLGLFNDKDGSKYRKKYFSKYSGKFLIGDNGVINPKTKGITICGRSDETLKQRGCRFGSSEIYNIVEQFLEVYDSICVSLYNQQMDESAVLFLKMRKGHQFTDDLVSRIRQTITKELTARHVPDIIIEAQDIPMEGDRNDSPIVWTPKENSGHQMKRFMKRIEQKYSVKFNGYWDLHKWSVDNVIEFWSEIWDYARIIYSKKYDKVVDLSIPLDQCPKWFEGARLNYTENILRHRENRVAFIFADEENETEKVTFNQLVDIVSLYAAALKKSGFKKGDVAAGYISNKKEAIFTMYAVISIGGIWTGALPQLGSKAVLSRLSQIEPKILLTTDQFYHNKEQFNLLQNIEEIVNRLPSLEKVLIVPSRDSSKLIDTRKIRNSCFLDDFLKSGKEADGSVPPIKFEQVSMSHPIFISFTSGTTGLPKPVMHGSGILLSIFKDYFIHCDSEPGSVWLGPSPAGWVTWILYVSVPLFGSTGFIYEGFPFFLSPTYMWDMVDEHKMSHLFMATSIIEEMIKRNYMPTEKHSLKSLKVFFLGGSIVKPSTYDDVYQGIEGDFLFSSGFGCTEFVGSGFLSDFTLPLHRGEISAITLGYYFECLNDEGEHVLGETGELAIISPVPNLPLGLFNDKDGTKYREKYFNKYPGKFLVGDYAVINPETKGIRICGRSDETLKQRGCRFGSSEIYNIVEQFQEVYDSICVSLYHGQMDESAVLFLKMREGHQFNDDLVCRIRQTITKELTARHVPDIIIEAQDIPYNVNGKKMELLVKKIINNKPYISDFVMNPECLKHYINRKELCIL